MSKIAIVTGANGFIGSALVNHLTDDGYTVYAIVRNEKKNIFFNKEKVVTVYSSYDEYYKLKEQIECAKNAIFIHMAWEFRGDKLYDEEVQLNNIQGTCNAARAACELGCKRFVFMTSFFEHKKDYYDGFHGLRMADDSSIYGKCKKCASDLSKIICHRNGIEFMSIMLSNIFGKGDRSNRAINTMIRNMILGRDVPVVEGKRLYDYIYIDDAVEGIKILSEKGNCDEEYYLGNNALRPFKDFVSDMRDAINPNAELLFGAFPDTSFIDFQRIDLYKAYRDTGFQPRCDIYRSFIETAEWLKRLDNE